MIFIDLITEHFNHAMGYVKHETQWLERFWRAHPSGARQGERRAS